MKSTTYWVHDFKSNQIFGTKRSKIHRIQNKLIEYKIFELKYANRKLSNVWKYKQVGLVLVDFCITRVDNGIIGEYKLLW